MLRLDVQLGKMGSVLGLHGTGQVQAASWWGHEKGKQAAGVHRLVSPLPVPWEIAVSDVIAYSSCDMQDGSVNQCFTLDYLPGPSFVAAGEGAVN